MNKYRKFSLSIAETIDAWRIIPRTVVVLYSCLVVSLYLWFRSIPTFTQTSCDAGVLMFLTDKGVDVMQAQEIACTIVDVVGGPTTAQSTFVTTVIGLSAGIFGLYASTGRRWEGGLPKDISSNISVTSDTPPGPPGPTEPPRTID